MNSQQAIELLRQMICIPSTSGYEGGVADLLAARVAAEGYEFHRSGNNLWICSHNFAAGRPTVLLDAHIDTVRPSAAWSRDPFAPTIENGRLYGLGSNDTGGNVVSMLAAFLDLDSRPQPCNFIWLASAEEENTGRGGIKSVVPLLGRVDLAIIGEPTEMNAAVAEKGLLVVDCIAHGRAGHAARNEGVNALYKAVDDIEWFRGFEFPRHSELLGDVKMTVTGISAGSLHNVVPAECRFTVDIRVNECYTNAEVLEIIRAHVGSEVVPRSINLGSSSIPLSHSIVRRAVALGRTCYASPTTSNQAVLPYVSLKMGVGNSARSHSADEYILLDEIVQAIDIFIKLLDGYEVVG